MTIVLSVKHCSFSIFKHFCWFEGTRINGISVVHRFFDRMKRKSGVFWGGSASNDYLLWMGHGKSHHCSNHHSNGRPLDMDRIDSSASDFL